MPDEAKMPAYNGVNGIVCAAPLTDGGYAKKHHAGLPMEAYDHEGYQVRYPDGFDTWKPKDVFEAAYRLVSDDERRMV